MKHDIFEFNHIDNLLSEDEIKTIKELNEYYHKKFWCFEKNYKKKIEMTKIAFTTYEKVLVELLSALRGDEFDKDQFIDKMKVVDAMIIDQTPLADKFVKKYDRKYK